MRAAPGSVPANVGDSPGFPAFGGSIANDCSSRPEGGGSVKYKPMVLLSETAFCSWSKCFL